MGEELEVTENPGEEFEEQEEQTEQEETPVETPVEAPAAEEPADPAEEEESTAAEDDDAGAREIAELRRLAREQHRQLKTLQSQLEKHGKSLQENQLLGEEGDGAADDGNAQAARTEHLKNIVSLMEVNPKYEDVREVCSQDNFNDTIMLMAKQYVQEHGGELNDTADQIEAYVWSLDNPYTVMYQRIKELHPSYAAGAAKPSVAEAVEGKKKGDESKAPKEPEEIAPSLSNLPAGDRNGGGWTSKAIDALPEDELHKVPANIYEAYLRNELS